MAYGIAIQIDESPLYKFSKLIHPDLSNTNNLAEYLGLKEILKTILNFQSHPIIIFSDSQLVINQMFSNWKIRNGGYTQVAIECKKLIKNFPNIQSKWIPSKENFICHDLVTQKFKEVWGR